MTGHRSRGFTAIEVIIVVTITTIATYGLAGLLGSSRTIERNARTKLLLEHDLRAGLLTIADTLRNIPESELAGFDDEGLSTGPTFKRIIGASDGTPTLGVDATIEWRPKSGGRSDDPGGIYLVEGTAATLLVPKVTEDSFLIDRSGDKLRIELEVRRATGEANEIQTQKGQVVVALRN